MTSWDAEIGYHSQFAIAVRSKTYIPRDDIFQELYENVKYSSSPISITSVEAPTGYGKTVILARLVQKLTEKYPRQAAPSVAPIRQGNNEIQQLNEDPQPDSNNQLYDQKKTIHLEDQSSPNLSTNSSVAVVDEGACCVFPSFFSSRTASRRKIEKSSTKIKTSTSTTTYVQQSNISSSVPSTPLSNTFHNDDKNTPKLLSNSTNRSPIGSTNISSPVSMFSSFLITPAVTPVVICRFCGISRHSSTLAGLLLSILFQIHLHFKLPLPAYLQSSSQPLWSTSYIPASDIEYLSDQLQHFMCLYPVLLLIDGVDRLSFPETSYHSVLEFFGQWLCRFYNNSDEVYFWHKQSRCVVSHNISHINRSQPTNAKNYSGKHNSAYMTAYGLPNDHPALRIVDIPVLSQSEGELLLRRVMSLPTTSVNMHNTVSQRLKCLFDDTNNSRIEAKTERLWRYVQRRVKLHCVPLYIVLVGTLMNYRIWSESDDVDDDEEDEEETKQLQDSTGSQYLYWQWTGFQDWLMHSYSPQFQANASNYNSNNANLDDKVALSGTSNIWSNMTTTSMFALLHHPASSVALTQNKAMSLYIGKDITSVATQILAYLETKLEITIMQNALTLLMLTPTGVCETEMIDLLCLQYDIQSLFFPCSSEIDNNDRDTSVQEGRFQVQEMWLSVLSCLSSGIPWLMSQFDTQRYICQHEILRVAMHRRYVSHVSHQQPSNSLGTHHQDTHITTLQLLLTRYFANLLPISERKQFHISPQPLLLSSSNLISEEHETTGHEGFSGRKDDFFLSQRQARLQEKLQLWSLCRNPSGMILNDRRLVESMRHVSQCVSLLSSDDLAAIVGDVCHVSHLVLHHSLLGRSLFDPDTDKTQRQRNMKVVSQLEVFYRESLLRLYKTVRDVQTSSLESTLLAQTVQFVSHILSHKHNADHLYPGRSNDVDILSSTCALDTNQFLYLLTQQITQNQGVSYANTSFDLLLAQWQELLSRSPDLSQYMQKNGVVDYLVQYNSGGVMKNTLTGIISCSGGISSVSQSDNKHNKEDIGHVLHNTSSPVALSLTDNVEDMFYYHTKRHRLVKHSVLSGLRQQIFDFSPLNGVENDPIANNNSNNTNMYANKHNRNDCVRVVTHCLSSPNGRTVVTLASVTCSGMETQGEMCVWDTETGRCRFQFVCEVSLLPSFSVATLSNKHIFVFGSERSNGLSIWDVMTGDKSTLMLDSRTNKSQENVLSPSTISKDDERNADSNVDDVTQDHSNPDTSVVLPVENSDINILTTSVSMVSVSTVEGDKLLLIQGVEQLSAEDPADEFPCLNRTIKSVSYRDWNRVSIFIYHNQMNGTPTHKSNNQKKKWTCTCATTLSDLFVANNKHFSSSNTFRLCDAFYNHHSQTFQLVTSQLDLSNVGSAVHIWDVDILYQHHVRINNKVETSLSMSMYSGEDNDNDNDTDDATEMSTSMASGTLDSSIHNNNNTISSNNNNNNNNNNNGSSRASFYQRVKTRVSFFSRASTSSSVMSPQPRNNLLNSENNNNNKISNNNNNNNNVVGMVASWSVAADLSTNETVRGFFLVNNTNNDYDTSGDNAWMGVFVSNHSNHTADVGENGDNDKLPMTIKVFELESRDRNVVSSGRDSLVRSSYLFGTKNKSTMEEGTDMSGNICTDTPNRLTYVTDTLYLSLKDIANLSSVTCRIDKDTNQRHQVTLVSSRHNAREVHIATHSLTPAHHSVKTETANHLQGTKGFSRLQLQSEQQLPLLVFSHLETHDTPSASSSSTSHYLATRHAVYNSATQTVLFLFRDIFETDPAQEAFQNYVYAVQSLCFSGDNRLLFAVVLKENCDTCVTTGELWTIDVSSASVVRKQVCHEQDTLHFWPRRQRRVVWVRHSSGATQDDTPSPPQPLSRDTSTDETVRHSETHAPSQDGRVDLYEAETQQLLLRCPKHHRQVVFQVAFHPLGDLAVSVDYDGTLKLWRTVTGEVLHTVTQAVHSFQWLLFWDTPSLDTAGETVKRLLLTPYDTSRDRQTPSVDIDNSETQRHGFFVWDCDTGRQQGVVLLPATHRHIHAFHLYRDVFVYQLWKNDRHLFLFDVKTQRLLTTLQLPMAVSSFAVQDTTGRLVVKLKRPHSHHNNTTEEAAEQLMEFVLTPM